MQSPWNQTSLTDPEGNTTSWVYDTLKRVILDTNELNDSRRFAYDANSNLTTRTDRNGREIEYAYDHLNQVNEESWYVGGVLQETRDFRYDAIGNLTSVNSDEAVYAFAYDNLDRRTQTIRDYLTLSAMPSVTTNSVYDLNNRRTQLAATIGSTDDFVTDFAYDSLSRMTGIEQHGVTGGNAVANKRIDLAYNAAGQFDTITRYADLAATQSVATTDFLYDNTGRLSDLTHTQNATTLAGYSYSYDAASQLAQIDSLIDGVTTYTQDLTGQPTAADHASQTDESYTYDDNGNRTGSGTSTGDDNQLLSDGTYNYQYDPEGNWIKKTNIATGATTDYTWDHHNKLIEVTEKNASAVVIKTVQYGYDGFDHKIWKKVITSSGTQTEVYVYDGLRQEQSGTGDVMILRFDGGDVTNRYLHGPAVDQILADEQVTNNTTPGDVFWPLTDHLGSVRDIAEYDATTGITSIANHIVYYSFGNRTSETNAAVDTFFGFTGRECDDGVNLQFNRARPYDPNTGTWLSNDPIGFAAGDPNLYRYVGNQPTTAIDPSGLVIETPWDVGNVCLGVGTCGWNIYTGNWWGAAEDFGGIVIDVGATIVPGMPAGAGTAIKCKRLAQTADQIRELQKSVQTLTKRIREHQAKLEAYIANPAKFDHRGILNNVPLERRQSIINGRINHLQGEIKAWHDQVDQLRSTIISLGG